MDRALQALAAARWLPRCGVAPPPLAMRRFSMKTTFPGMAVRPLPPSPSPATLQATPSPSPPPPVPSQGPSKAANAPPPPPLAAPDGLNVAPAQRERALRGQTFRVSPIGFAPWRPGMARRTSWPLFGLSTAPAVPPGTDAIAKEFFEKGARWLGDHTTLCAAGAPPPSWSEVAVLGRSNVGKSSLLNSLLGSKDGKFVPVSKRPGSTVALDFYGCGTGPDPEFVLVDTPGYGYSSRGKSSHKAWMRSISSYLGQRSRTVLRRVLLLVDTRLGIQQIDKEVLDMMDEAGLACQLILTKADTATDAQLEDVAMRSATELAKHKTPYPVLHAVSSSDMSGVGELKASLVMVAKLHKTRTGAGVVAAKGSRV
jgi:GTP-binding protein